MKQFLILFLILFFSQQGYSQPPADTASTGYVKLDREPKPRNLKEFIDSVGYPEDAQFFEIVGKVVVQVYVSKKGKTMDYRILSNPHPKLTEAVTSKLHILKWDPGYYQRKRVNVWVTIPIDFQLNER